MSQFYRIDFAAEHHVRRGYLKWCVAAVVLGLIGGGAWFAWQWYQEWKLPVLKPRLAQYQDLVGRVEDVSAAWHKTESACREIRDYVEREDQVSPEKVFPVLAALKDWDGHSLADGTPLCFQPVHLEFNRNAGVLRLTGVTFLPKREKTAYCSRVANAVSDAITNSLVGLGPGIGKYAYSFKWKKGAPTVQDDAWDAEISVTFKESKPFVFPAVPRELDAALQSAEAWRGAVRKCLVRLPRSANMETVESALKRIVLSSRQALGADYDLVKAFFDKAVDPLAVCEKIHGAAGRGGDFEIAWNELAQRRWKREITLDNSRLDAEIAKVVTLSGALPRNQVFDDTQKKCSDYLATLSKGVRRQHIVEEDRFVNDILLPCVSERGRLPATLVAKIMPDEKAKRVAFPAWKVALGTSGDKAASPTSSAGVSLADVERVLSNIATNPVGMWVTSIALDFDVAKTDQGPRWGNVKAVAVEGRVPCWMEKIPAEMMTPSTGAEKHSN